MSGVNRTGLAKTFSAGILHGFKLRGLANPSAACAPGQIDHALPSFAR
jgi:hypothetical protein